MIIYLKSIDEINYPVTIPPGYFCFWYFVMKLYKISCILFSFFLISCSSTPIQESTGQYLDSSAVTVKVKTRLMDMLGAKNALSIKVKTYKNAVQLSGFVNSEMVKKRAGWIADNTLWVTTEQNDLIVK